MDSGQRRSTLERLFWVALAAVDPERLTRDALAGAEGPVTLVAIGKAAAGMSRGAAAALGEVDGICVTSARHPVPNGVELVVGDHPVPRTASFFAGRRALERAAAARNRLIALISGGGSALCDHPIDGIPPTFVSEVNARLLDSGASIDEMNLVRRHLSAVKNGGIARVASVPVATLVISDVCGADLSLVASGPTLPGPIDPDAAIDAMARRGIEVPEEIRRAIESFRPAPTVAEGPVELLADGHTAIRAMVGHAAGEGLGAVHVEGWLEGPVDEALDRFLGQAGPGLTVAAGEPDVTVTGGGRGGRNTHAALLAAFHLANTDFVFGAFATDGIDGNTRCAGAIVDGESLQRGGDAGRVLQRSDSATYLERAGDLMVTGPTGTNVADIWAIWK